MHANESGGRKIFLEQHAEATGGNFEKMLTRLQKQEAGRELDGLRQARVLKDEYKVRLVKIAGERGTHPDTIKEMPSNLLEEMSSRLDQIDALAVMEFLKREVIPEAHAVSLYDTLNLWTTASDASGKPQNRDDQSDQAHAYHTQGRIAYGVDEEIWFQNTVAQCDDPRYLRILLRDKNGNWQCAALDASGFLNPRNREIVHLVILPKENFEAQQDQVWEILHAFGFQPQDYHNVFFEVKNNDVTPQSVVDTIRLQIGQLLGA